MENRVLKYDAFISYRHCELDKFTAINIHKKLEAFKLPKSALHLVNGEKTKISRVFRDEDELPLSDNLSEPIDLALSNSEFLIVICTPRLKESMWCQREIETFMKMHGRDHILLVLAEGEPVDSFPEILTYEEVTTQDEEGNTVTIRKNTEPLAADVRGKDKRAMLKAMDNAVIKLAAAMFNLNYDDIKQRHREQRLKKLVAVWSGISAAAIVFLLVCVFFLVKINVQKNEIRDKYAGTMAVAAEEMLADGRRLDAIYALSEVLPTSNYINSESYRVLADALNLYGTDTAYVPEKTFEMKSAVLSMDVSKDGKYLLAEGINFDYHLFDVESGEEIASFLADYSDNTMPCYGFDGENGVVYSDGNQIFYYEIATADTRIIADNPGYILWDENCKYTLVLSQSVLSGYCDGEQVYTLNFEEYGIEMDEFTDYKYGFSSDGEYISFALSEFDGRTLTLLVETGTGKLLTGMYLEVSGNCLVTTDGEVIFLHIADKNTGAGTMCLINSYSADIIGEGDSSVSFATAVRMMDGKLLIYSSNNAVMLDSRSFETLGQLSGSSIIISDCVKDEMAVFADYQGHIHYLGGEYNYGADATYNIFQIIPDGKLLGCEIRNEKMFYAFSDANYVVLYAPEKENVREIIANDAIEKEELFIDFKDASSELDSLKDLEKEYVYSTVYSSDNRYILVTMYDGSLRFYNAKTHNVEKVIYSIDTTLINGFVYEEQNGVYIINASPYSYILDKKLNCIGKMYLTVGMKDKSFVVTDGEKNYVIPFVQYKDAVLKARKMIGDYKPSDGVAEKYGFNR